MVVRGKTKVTRKGQITIPAEVRAAFGLREGDSLVVSFDEVKGALTIDRAKSVVEQTAGIFKPKVAVPSDIYELVAEEKRRTREGMADAAIERDRRSRGA